MRKTKVYLEPEVEFFEFGQDVLAASDQGGGTLKSDLTVGAVDDQDWTGGGL